MEEKKLKENWMKEYRKVLKHRNNCPKWTKEFCLECFGGGLTKFSENFTKIQDIDKIFD